MNEEIKPLNPKDIVRHKQNFLPKEVIESVNELITKKWNGSTATISQTELVVLILHKLNKKLKWRYMSSYVWANNLLDFEDIYREEGWLVTYDKPSYDGTDDLDATFTFKVK